MFSLSYKWWKHWTSEEKYLNKDAQGIMRFPGFSEDAIKYLLRKRTILGVGTDTLSTDIGSSSTFSEHHLLLSHNKINIENLTALDQAPDSGAYLMIMPMKIAKGSGAPSRIIALTPK